MLATIVRQVIRRRGKKSLSCWDTSQPDTVVYKYPLPMLSYVCIQVSTTRVNITTNYDADFHGFFSFSFFFEPFAILLKFFPSACVRFTTQFALVDYLIITLDQQLPRRRVVVSLLFLRAIWTRALYCLFFSFAGVFAMQRVYRKIVVSSCTRVIYIYIHNNINTDNLSSKCSRSYTQVHRPSAACLADSFTAPGNDDGRSLRLTARPTNFNIFWRFKLTFNILRICTFYG